MLFEFTEYCFHFFMLLIRFLFHFICPCFKGLHNFVRCLCLASSILNSLMPILLRLNKLAQNPDHALSYLCLFVVALDFESHHFFWFLFDLNSLTSLLNFSLLLAAASDSERSLLISRFSSSRFVLYSAVFSSCNFTIFSKNSDRCSKDESILTIVLKYDPSKSSKLSKFIIS